MRVAFSVAGMRPSGSLSESVSIPRGCEGWRNGAGRQCCVCLISGQRGEGLTLRARTDEGGRAAVLGCGVRSNGRGALVMRERVTNATLAGQLAELVD